MKHLRIYLLALQCTLLGTFTQTWGVAESPEENIQLQQEAILIGKPLADIISEVSFFLLEEDNQQKIAQDLLCIIESLEKSQPVEVAHLKTVLPTIINYVEQKYAILRGDVTSLGGGDGATGAPLTCDLGSIVRLLRELEESIAVCCAIIQVELQETSSLIQNIAVDLEISTSSIVSIANTFSTFEALTQDLQVTVSLLEVATTELASTVITITQDLSGTFTVIDSCCQSLSLQFINTNTLLLNEFSSTYTEFNQGFSTIYSEFQSTWTQLNDLLDISCACLPQFQSTWDLLEVLDNDCGCLSQFQQTWTILDSLMLTISGGCDCTAQFNETWALLAEGFNATYTLFQGTFTTLNASFETTFSLLEDIDCGYITLFDERQQGSRLDLINTKFNYGISSYDTTTSTFGGGFVSSFTSMALVNSGTGSTGFAQVQSLSALRNRAGHEADAYFSAQFPTGGAATSTQWIGLFDSQNGFAVGYSNINFALLYRNAGVNTVVFQSNFNQDPLDGSGPSKFVLDPTKLNLFRIAFAWLGASPIKYQILSETGQWITFHTIERNNQFFVPSVRNPYLPMTAQVNKSGGASSLQLATGGWNVGIIGEPSNSSSRYFTTNTLTGAFIGVTERHILTLRNKPIFQGQTNRIAARISFISGGNVNPDGNTSVVRLYRNATVTGTTFTDVNTANSVMAVSTSGTYTPGTGTYLITLFTQTDNPTTVVPIQADEITIILEPNETATFTGQRISSDGLNPRFFIGVSWEELF